MPVTTIDVPDFDLVRRNVNALPALGKAADTASLPVALSTEGAASLAKASANAFDVATTITRPANVTAYTANDVLGGALDLGVLGPSAGAIMITGAQLEADIAAVPTGMSNFRLYLYSVTPPSALADNAAWDLPSGDRASFLGFVDVGVPVDLGSTLYVETANVGKQVLLAGTHLFGYLVTIGAFTPNANSEVYKLTLHTQGV